MPSTTLHKQITASKGELPSMLPTQGYPLRDSTPRSLDIRCVRRLLRISLQTQIPPQLSILKGLYVASLIILFGSAPTPCEHRALFRSGHPRDLRDQKGGRGGVGGWTPDPMYSLNIPFIYVCEKTRLKLCSWLTKVTPLLIVILLCTEYPLEFEA